MIGENSYFYFETVTKISLKEIYVFRVEIKIKYYRKIYVFETVLYFLNYFEDEVTTIFEYLNFNLFQIKINLKCSKLKNKKKNKKQKRKQCLFYKNLLTSFL